MPAGFPFPFQPAIWPAGLLLNPAAAVPPIQLNPTFLAALSGLTPAPTSPAETVAMSDEDSTSRRFSRSSFTQGL